MEEVMGAGAQKAINPEEQGVDRPGERGLNIGIGGGTGEMQAAVIQLGRIADQLQDIVNIYKAQSAVKPQPLSGNVG